MLDHSSSSSSTVQGSAPPCASIWYEGQFLGDGGVWSMWALLWDPLWPNWWKRCAWTGQYGWPRHLADMEHCLYAIQQGIKWRAKIFTRTLTQGWVWRGSSPSSKARWATMTQTRLLPTGILIPSKRLSGCTQARLAWNRYGQERATRVRACNYVKIAPGRNFPPVLKIVTHTAQAA